jgi:hypothetical protein
LADAILGVDEEGSEMEDEDYEARLDMLTRLAYAIIGDDDDEFGDDVSENQISWTLERTGHSAQFEEWAYMTGHRTLNYDADDEDEFDTEDDYNDRKSSQNMMNRLVLAFAGEEGFDVEDEMDGRGDAGEDAEEWACLRGSRTWRYDGDERWRRRSV